MVLPFRRKNTYMELNINSPAYFSSHYGVDDEVYRFCRAVYSYFRDKEYSDTLHTIGIMPIVAPQELYDQGKWKERVQMWNNNTCASIMILMDFDSYYHADSSEKILLIRDMIFKAIKKVKSRGHFDAQKFMEDFLQADFSDWC